MTIRHMRIFLEVCSCGYNLTKAAAGLFMSQPAVTLAIQEMEQYYGVALFDRLGRRLYLTEAGRQFEDYSRRVLSLFDDMEKELKNWDVTGTLRVGSSITIGSQFMPGYVETFMKLYPKAEIRVRIGISDMIEEMLTVNELDIGLVETPVHREHLISEAYMEDRLAVIVPAGDAFAEKLVMTKDEFAKSRFLLREAGSGTREVFNRVMEQHGLHVEPVWESMSTAALVNAVTHGLGVAVLPRRMVAEALTAHRVREVEVADLEFKRSFYLVYHQDKLLTGSMRHFMDLCRSYEQDYPDQKMQGMEYQNVETEGEKPC